MKWFQKVTDNGIIKIENHCTTLTNILIDFNYKSIELVRAPDIKPYFGRDVGSVIDLYSHETVINKRSKAFMDGKHTLYNQTGILGGTPILNNNLLLKIELLVNENDLETSMKQIEFHGIDYVYNYEPCFEQVYETTVDITKNNQVVNFGNEIGNVNGNVNGNEIKNTGIPFSWMFFVIENLQNTWLTFDHIFFTFLSPLYDTATLEVQCTAHDLRYAIPVHNFDKVPVNSFYTFTNNFQTLTIQSMKIHFSEPFDVLRLKLFFVDG